MTTVTSGAPRQVLCPIVVGRDDEQRVVDDALASARAQAGSVVFISGEAGIGKTRLAREAQTRAGGTGMEMLRGRAVATAAPIPFRPITEAFHSTLRATGPPPAAELTAYRPALRGFVPEWASEPVPAETAPLLVFEGIVRLLVALAGQRGLLLVLEDLHWADADTLAVVEYLADNVADERVVCLATIRSDEPGPALERARALAARRAATLLPLGRLSGDQVQQMVHAAFGVAPPPGLVDVVEQRSEGVPFLVEELLSAYVTHADRSTPDGGWPDVSSDAAAALPASYRELVRARLAALDAMARTVVTAAAILGRTFDWSLIAAVLGLEREQVLACLRTAVDAQLITTSFDAGFRFRHALVTEAIVAELLPPERVELSRRAAEAIEAAFPGLPGDWCERAADLREAAGDRVEAARHLTEAGARALKRAALATAEALLERARTLVADDPWHRMGIDRVLIEVLSQAGKTARIEEIGASLLQFSDRKQELIRLAAWAPVHLPLARALAAADNWAAAREHLRRGKELALGRGAEQLLVRLGAIEAQALVAEGHYEGARAAAAAALLRADLLELPDAAFEALMASGDASANLGDGVAAAAAFARANDVAEGAERSIWQIRALLEIGSLEMWRGTTAAVRRARDLATRTGAIASFARAGLLMGWAQLLRFDLAAAAASLEETLDACRRYQLHLTPEVHLARAALDALLGDHAAMEDAITAAVATAPDPATTAAGAAAARGLLALVQEDHPRAGRALDAAVEAPAGRAPAHAALLAPGLHALLRAIERQSAEKPRRAIAGLPADAFAEFIDAATLGHVGRRDEACTRFTDADEMLAPLPWLRHLCRRILADAAVIDGWGDPARWLRESVVFFESAGMQRNAAACKALLRKAGAPVPRKGRGESAVPAAWRAHGVTSREMDVLNLVVQGMSNREIAGQLFVSPRTVETHVASTMRKLGAGSRAALVALARDAPTD